MRSYTLNQNSVFVVRHAQSQHHINGMTGGWTDTGLTDFGLTQAAQLADRLSDELRNQKIHLISSDLQRAVQTAKPCATVLHQAIHLEPCFREFNNGFAAGKTREYANSILRKKNEPPIDWQLYPQSETWRSFFQRVAKGMEKLIEAKSGPHLIVTHGGTIINIIAWWLRMDIEQLNHISFAAEPSSLTMLDINEWGERRLVFLNDTSHLSKDILSPLVVG